MHDVKENYRKQWNINHVATGMLTELLSQQSIAFHRSYGQQIINQLFGDMVGGKNRSNFGEMFPSIAEYHFA